MTGCVARCKQAAFFEILRRGLVAPHGALDVPASRLLLKHFPFVVKLSPAAQTNQHLCPAAIEINFKRNQSEAFFFGLFGELLDFAPMHEELARSLGNVVQAVGLHVFRNVAPKQPNFIIFHLRISVLERNLTGAQALHFASYEHDAAFERVQHFVFVPGAPILGDEPLIVVLAIGWGILFAPFSRDILSRGKTPSRNLQ